MNETPFIGLSITIVSFCNLFRFTSDIPLISMLPVHNEFRLDRILSFAWLETGDFLLLGTKVQKISNSEVLKRYTEVNSIT